MQFTTEAYSFKQLFEKKRNDYFNKKDFKEKEEIINNFICDQKVSNDFLEILSKKNPTKQLINTFEVYFNLLKYSMTVKENSNHYKFFQNLCNKFKITNNMEKFEYLSKNDPINNFKKINEYYSNIENITINTPEDEVQKLIDKIDKFINDMINVYETRLKEYYFPANQAFPIYAYNYYSYKIFNTLKKLQTVKRIKLFKTSNNNLVPSNISIKKGLYEQINSILSNFSQLFNKFNYNNIGNDLIVLKIVSLYLTIFEKSRSYHSIIEQIREVSACLNSTPITCDILKNIEIYRENSDIPVNSKEWDSIGLNENVYVNNFDTIKTQIKRFNNNILKYNMVDLNKALISPKISDLNMNGLINYGLIKSNKEIEDYSKSLLKKIFSSKLYINNFIKYDMRFSKKKEEMLKSIFNGTNKEEIFKELWESIIFIPMLKQRLSGFNTRPQYSIFINSENNFNYEHKFDKIIPRIHCEINAIYHEITLNLTLLLAANLEEKEFETIIINNNNDLNALQNKYYDEYAQNSIKYQNFDDFGNLMEIVLYGIRPRIFRTFSSLFCLNLDSYDMSEERFRDTCLNLYKSKITITKNVIDKIINNSDFDANEILKDDKNENKKQNMELIINLIKSNFSKLLSEFFLIDNDLQNESYVEDENARNLSNNFIFNDEYVIETDYCDKLD